MKEDTVIYDVDDVYSAIIAEMQSEIDSLKKQLDGKKCRCTPDESTGCISIDCCNICGLPV